MSRIARSFRFAPFSPTSEESFYCYSYTIPCVSKLFFGSVSLEMDKRVSTVVEYPFSISSTLKNLTEKSKIYIDYSDEVWKSGVSSDAADKLNNLWFIGARGLSIMESRATRNFAQVRRAVKLTIKKNLAGVEKYPVTLYTTNVASRICKLANRSFYHLGIRSLSRVENFSSPPSNTAITK